MTKQIPLRLDDDGIEMLERVKLHHNEKTANKAIISMLSNHIHYHDRMVENDREIQRLSYLIERMKHHYEAINDHKDELQELMK